jgi:hypothetical protein
VFPNDKKCSNVIDFRVIYTHKNSIKSTDYRVLFIKKEYSVNCFYISGVEYENKIKIHHNEKNIQEEGLFCKRR